MMFRGEVWLDFNQSGCGRVKKKGLKSHGNYRLPLVQEHFRLNVSFGVCLSVIIENWITG